MTGSFSPCSIKTLGSSTNECYSNLDGDTIMFFGATSFASTTFSGVGIQNVTVLVNGKRVDIASYRVRVGDVIGPKPKSRELPAIQEAITSLRLTRPDWLECNYLEGKATIISNPGLDSMSVEVDIARVIEYYAKRG